MLYILAASSSMDAGMFSSEQTLFNSIRAYFKFLSKLVEERLCHCLRRSIFLRCAPGRLYISDEEPICVPVPMSAFVNVAGAPARLLSVSPSSKSRHSAPVSTRFSSRTNPQLLHNISPRFSSTVKFIELHSGHLLTNSAIFTNTPNKDTQNPSGFWDIF